MKKTFKFRAYSNKQTIQKTENVLELCHQIYNLCLSHRKDIYKTYKKSISCYQQMRQLTELKKEFPEFKQIPSQSLQDVIYRVDKAFQNFFRRVKNREIPGYPRFKSLNRYNSFKLSQFGWKLNDSILNITKIGSFKIKFHRPIQGDIKTVTICRNSAGKWYVCFSCDNVPKKRLPKNKKSIGLDVGCESFLTDSEGSKIPNPRFLKKSQDRLKQLQEKLSRQVKGSNRRKKTRLLIAKTYEKIYNQRHDFQHKVSKYYVDNYGKIYIEKMKAFTSFRNINKSMRDVAWFSFFNKLKYKAEEAGRQVIKVPSKNTSQICSQCGKIVPKDLGVRIHNCPHCNLTLDRDHNAALNILRLGASLQ